MQIKTIFTILVCVSFISCGKKDADKISEAQNCLDNSTSATVSLCTEKVSGLESAGAYLIRCAAAFIADGFDNPTRLSAAYNNMTNTGTGAAGTDASLSVMSALAFINGGSLSANQTNANNALTYCNKSGSKGLILLAGISSMATNLLTISQQAAACGNDINCSLNYAKTDPAAQAAVGAAAASAYTANCTGGQTSNQQFCNQFSAAVATAGGTNNSGALGLALINQYCASSHCP